MRAFARASGIEGSLSCLWLEPIDFCFDTALAAWRIAIANSQGCGVRILLLGWAL